MVAVVVALFSVGLAAIVQIGFWSYKRRLAIAALGGAFLLIYIVDMIYISSSRAIFLAPSLGTDIVDESAFIRSGWSVVVTWLLFSAFVYGGDYALRGRWKKTPTEVQTAQRVAPYFVLVGVLGVLVLTAVLQVGIADALAIRQKVFGDNPLALLGYYALPALVVFGVVLAWQTRGLMRVALYAAVVFAIAMTALTGSRTGLFLTALVPVGLLIVRRTLRSPSSRKKNLTLITLASLIVLVPVAGGSLYLSQTRGDSSTESLNFLQSVDISQSDVLIALQQSEDLNIGKPSYLTAVVGLVPRSLWENKPLTGNAETSLILAPERYETTQAEITAGLLGEGLINAGDLAPLPAAILLAGFALITDRLLRNRNEVVWALGILLLTRGVNLIRGDLSNVVTPIVIVLLVAALVFYRAPVTWPTCAGLRERARNGRATRKGRTSGL